METFVIAGLGNPGAKYEDTRHNVGFGTIDELSRRFGIAVDQKAHKALIGKGIANGFKVFLVKPQTYMNLSGESIRDIMDYYNVPIENLIVLCDDVYLKAGTMRIRKSGTHGGHHGIENIILHMASKEFKRVRIGVGPQPEHMDLANFVLAKYKAPEKKLMQSVYEEAANAVVTIMEDGVEKACSRFNGMVIE